MNTIVGGSSYGTVLVERLIHLSPPQVTGYVLDGVSMISGAPRDKTPYVSLCDSDNGEVGDSFLALCAKTRGWQGAFCVEKPTSHASRFDQTL